jgi:hypothetical protein
VALLPLAGGKMCKYARLTGVAETNLRVCEVVSLVAVDGEAQLALLVSGAARAGQLLAAPFLTVFLAVLVIIAH